MAQDRTAELQKLAELYAEEWFKSNDTTFTKACVDNLQTKAEVLGDLIKNFHDALLDATEEYFQE